MSGLPSPISPIDVAIVDPDLLWRVEYMNAVHKVNARDYAAVEDALEALTPQHGAVIVLGPWAGAEQADALAAARAERPELRTVVFVPEEDPYSFSASVETADRMIPYDTAITDFGQCVLELLPHSEPVVVETETDEGAETTLISAPVHARALPRRLAIVTSAKGGEGVSTVALNLAVSIASVPRASVALVDGEPFFGDLTMDMGQPPEPVPMIHAVPFSDDVADMLVSHPPHSDVVLVRQPVCNPVLLPRSPQVLREVIGLAGERADIVVVDAPLDLVLDAGLDRLAASVVLVTSRRTTSIKNALIAARRLEFADNVGLVVNEVDRHHDDLSAEKVAAAVGVPLLGHIPFNGALHRAAAKPRPVLIADGSSRYGRAMTALRRELAEHFPVTV